MAGAAGVTFRWGVSIRHLRAEEIGRILRSTPIKDDLPPNTLSPAGSAFAAVGPPSGDQAADLSAERLLAGIDVEDRSAAPVSTVMDETYKVAITRLGDRIRVGGLAEIASYDLTLNPRRRAAQRRNRSASCSAVRATRTRRCSGPGCGR